MRVLDSAFRVLATILALSVAAWSHAADWPQWCGPQRNGVSEETGLLKQWPTEYPKLVWQVKKIGSGYSTPAVVGERIYLLSNEGLENEFVQALGAVDGGKVWLTRIGKVGNPDQRPNYPAARSTPTVDGGSLYALGSDGDLACLETGTGKIVWQKSLRKDFAGKPGTWAYSESPLIDGDVLVCTPGGNTATLVALNKTTGDVLWKCALPSGGEAAYASAIVVEAGGIKQYVQILAKELVGVEAKTGKLLWHYDRTAKGSPAVIPTPVAAKGSVYSARGSYRRRPGQAHGPGRFGPCGAVVLLAKAAHRHRRDGDRGRLLVRHHRSGAMMRRVCDRQREVGGQVHWRGLALLRGRPPLPSRRERRPGARRGHPGGVSGEGPLHSVRPAGPGPIEGLGLPGGCQRATLHPGP